MRERARARGKGGKGEGRGLGGEGACLARVGLFFGACALQRPSGSVDAVWPLTHDDEDGWQRQRCGR